jgi:hypothetical protein
MIDQWVEGALDEGEVIQLHYLSGGRLYFNRDRAFVKYSTGDSVWLIRLNGEWVVSGIVTHDNIRWTRQD